MTPDIDPAVKAMHEEKRESLRSDLKPVWCPGCGDYGITAGLDRALQELAYARHEIAFVSGIGCSSRLPYFFDTYGFHTIHGRAAAVAVGVKVANPSLRVIVVGGDGDFFSIGTNHFIHAARRNIDLTAICVDNHIYGLTKGQASPTSECAFVTASTPYGAVEAPLNPLLIALAAGATFVAQSYAANSKHLTETFIAAERHRGFSFINVISTCPTFNKEKTFAYYKGRVSVTEEEAKQDLASALQFVVANQGRDLIGTFFAVHRPTFEVSQQRLAQAAQEKNGAPTMESILESFA